MGSFFEERMSAPPETELMERRGPSISATREVREKEGVQGADACHAVVEEEEEAQQLGGC